MRQLLLSVTLVLAAPWLVTSTYADPPTPVFVDECEDDFHRHYVAIGGTDCEDAPILLTTGNNSSPILPEIVDATQEADGRYNITIISVPDESVLLNTYIIQAQQSGIKFNVLRVIRRTATSSHATTLRLDDVNPIESIDRLGSFAMASDGIDGYTSTPVTVTSLGSPAVTGNVGFIAAAAITVLRIGGNLGSEELPPDASGGVITTHVGILEVGADMDGGHLLGQFAVTGANGGGESINQMIIHGSMGLEAPDPMEPYEEAAGALRTEGSIGLLRTSEVGPTVEIEVGDILARSTIGQFDVTTAFGGTGDFRGFLAADTVNNGSSTHQITVLGDFYGEFDFDDSITDHNASTPVIMVDGAFKAGASINLPADGLEGQIIFDRANTGAAWQSGEDGAVVVVGTEVLDKTIYLTPAADIGYGAAGRAEYRLHWVSCDPVESISTTDPPERLPAELHIFGEIDPESIELECIFPKPSVFLQFYGPVSILDDPPVKIRHYVGSGSWSNVSHLFEYEESAGGDEKRLEITPISGWAAGTYEITREPGGLNSVHVAPDGSTPAGINAFTYYVNVYVYTCGEALLAGFDLNSDDAVTEPGDIPAWLLGPADLNGDSVADAADIQLLERAATLYAEVPGEPVYYTGPWEVVE